MQRNALCRSRRELSNEYLLARIGVDTAENEPLELWGKIIQYYSFVSLLLIAFDFDPVSFPPTHTHNRHPQTHSHTNRFSTISNQIVIKKSVNLLSTLLAKNASSMQLQFYCSYCFVFIVSHLFGRTDSELMIRTHQPSTSPYRKRTRTPLISTRNMHAPRTCPAL